MSELEKKLFNDDAIPYIVQMLNEHMAAASGSHSEEINLLSVNLDKVTKEIDNIVSAISQGFIQDSFKEKMAELDKKKLRMEVRLHELRNKSKIKVLTENEVRKLFSVFKAFVAEKNIPECKKFIGNYVEKVLVFQDRIEVTMKVAVDTSSDHLQLRTTKKKIKK